MIISFLCIHRHKNVKRTFLFVLGIFPRPFGSLIILCNYGTIWGTLMRSNLPKLASLVRSNFSTGQFLFLVSKGCSFYRVYIVFHIILKKYIDNGYSSKPPQRDGKEYQQSMLRTSTRKDIITFVWNIPFKAPWRRP